MAINPGDSLNSVALPQKQALSSNYIDFTSSDTKGWAQQYVPDLMEKEAEVFGQRTISGFLEQVGAEEAMSADQVIWSEQGRLHLSYKGTTHGSNQTITIGNDIDGQTAGANHGIRVNDTVIISGASVTQKAVVTIVADAVITVATYDAVVIPTSAAVVVLVYSSEYGKGKSYVEAGGSNVTDRRGANEPKFKQFNNKPIIMKDYYEISGSDTAQVGWVEVSGEEGQSGYLWYLKAAGDTKARFTDYLEMAMLEAEKASGANGADNFVNAESY